MKLLPIILGGRANDPKNYYIFKSVSKNPTISGITTTSDVLVLSTVNGAQHRETYPAGTTSISFTADANTEIRVIGDISAIVIKAGKIQEYVARSRALTTVSVQYQGSQINVTKIDFSYCVNLAGTINFSTYNNTLKEIALDNCQALTGLSMSSTQTPVTKISVNNCTSLTTLSITYATALRALYANNCPALTTLNCGESVSLDTLELFGDTALTSIDVSRTEIKHIDVSSCENLQTLSMAGSAAMRVILAPVSSVTSIIAYKCYSLISIENLKKQTTLERLQLNEDSSFIPVDLSGLVNVKNLYLANTNWKDINFLPLTKLVSVNLEGLEIKKIIATNSADISTLDLDGCSKLEEIDVSSAISLSTGSPAFSHDDVTSVKLIKFRATENNPSQQVAAIITQSTVSDGVVYLNDQDAYYSTVETAALAKGWTIEPLA